MEDQREKQEAREGERARHTYRDGPPETSGAGPDPAVPRAPQAEHMEKAAGPSCCFCADGLEVELEFAEEAPSLQETLSAFFRRRLPL